MDLGKRLEVLLALAQHPLHAAVLGDVAHIGGEQAPAGLVDLADRQLDRERLAVGAEPLDLDPPADHARLAGPQIAPHALAMQLAHVRRNDQLGQRPTKRGAALDAEQALGGGIELDDGAVLVDRDQAVEGVVDGRGFERLAVGDPRQRAALGGEGVRDRAKPGSPECRQGRLGRMLVQAFRPDVVGEPERRPHEQALAQHMGQQQGQDQGEQDDGIRDEARQQDLVQLRRRHHEQERPRGRGHPLRQHVLVADRTKLGRRSQQRGRRHLAQRRRQHLPQGLELHAGEDRAVGRRQHLPVLIDQPEMAARIVESAQEAAQEIERERAADHPDDIVARADRCGMRHHPAGPLGVAPGPGPGFPPCAAARPEAALQEILLAQQVEQLVARRAAGIGAVPPRKDAQKVLLAGEIVAALQIRHGAVRDPHVGHEPLRRRQLGAGTRPPGERVATGPRAARGGLVVTRIGGPAARVALGEVDFRPGRKRAHVVAHGLGDARQQDVVRDRLVVQLLQQLAPLQDELIPGQDDDRDHQRDDAGGDDQRVATKRGAVPARFGRCRIIRCAPVLPICRSAVYHRKANRSARTPAGHATSDRR